ncbi:DNA-processing protein DprA [Convivina praedatoris]|uniref:DNA-processing protein DprA n=1 Tax=Convivina praedatoris TaxID=2880963 RepID=UPI00200DDF11|nr:DNA-processing protein DprA [Convivina sp. LMG 32447]CAH1853914.1 hypothetical protein R078138_00758 [Convivina sp. LMG 32447]
MILKQFLLALWLTPGIGKERANRAIHAIEKCYAPTQYPWEFEDLCHIIELTKQTSVTKLAGFKNGYLTALNQAQQFKDPYLSYFDDAYPERLRQIYQPPLILFYQGHLDALKLPSLSVVGTRSASPYSLNVLRTFLPKVVNTGVAIVSGLAKGVDVMAHQITFSQQGVPIAVIGTGINVAYPANHHSLQKQIGQQGLLLSEYPPNTSPRRAHFPDRNRIIAGLSSATLVIEAKRHSGSLITANSALQNNRQVLAIPGSIFSTESQGTNELIKAGALPVTKLSDIMEVVTPLI